jgi:quinol monooxygenase YgiN
MAKPALIAKFTAIEGKRDELVAACQKMIDYVTANEPGTEVYVLHTDNKDPNVLWWYEMYADGDSLKTHGGSDAMKAAGKEFAPLITGRAELTFLTPVAGKGLQL